MFGATDDAGGPRDGTTGGGCGHGRQLVVV